MIRRRSNGEGSLSRRADGRWQACYTVADGGGPQRRFVYGKTRDICARKLREALAARDTGRAQPRQVRETVGHYLQTWLEGIKPTMRARSWERNEEHVRLHLIPRLGAITLTKLEAPDIRRTYAQLLSTGLSAATVHRAHATLRTALQQAFKDNMVSGNVADRVEPPRPTPREMVTLSPLQAQRLLEAARGDRREALYVAAVTAGLRLGELLALRWPDVNLDAGTLAVTGTLSRIRGEGLRIGEPKTKRSRRRVELSGVAVEALSRHRTRQLEQRVAAANLWQDRGLVFCNPTGNYLLAPQVLVSLHELLERAGLPRVRFHDLRHTAATLLLSQGIHTKIVSEMLGHSTVAITLDLYSHVTMTMQREAADAMDVLFRSS